MESFGRTFFPLSLGALPLPLALFTVPVTISCRLFRATRNPSRRLRVWLARGPATPCCLHGFSLAPPTGGRLWATLSCGLGQTTPSSSKDDSLAATPALERTGATSLSCERSLSVLDGAGVGPDPCHFGWDHMGCSRGPSPSFERICLSGLTPPCPGMGRSGGAGGRAGWRERRAVTGVPMAAKMGMSSQLLSVPRDHTGGRCGREGRCRRTLRSLVNSLSGQ